MSRQTDRTNRVHRIFEEISEGYDAANERISLGLQRFWKEDLIRRAVRDTASGDRVLDACCGTGDIGIAIAKRRPDLRVTGLDFSENMLRGALRKSRGIRNIRFKCGDVCRLPYADDTFGAVCISFGLRNTPDYKRTIRELHRVLKPGGTLYLIDSFVPQNGLVYPFYRFYFRDLMPLLGGGRRHRKEYLWLWSSTKHFLNPDQCLKLLGRCGFCAVTIHKKMFGACILFCGKKAAGNKRKIHA